MVLPYGAWAYLESQLKTWLYAVPTAEAINNQNHQVSHKKWQTVPDVTHICSTKNVQIKSLL